MITITMSVVEAKELLALLKNDMEEYVLDGAIARIHDRLVTEIEKGRPKTGLPSE